MLIRKLIILGVLGGMILGSGFTVNTFAQTTPVPTPDEPAAIYMTYLPLMLTSGNTVPTSSQLAVGAETINAIDQVLMTNLTDAGGTWTRHTVLEWDKIEPNRTNPPTYNWGQVNTGKQAELAAASAKGVNVIATIKYTPRWAQKYPNFLDPNTGLPIGLPCGPVAADKFDEFAQFVAAAVALYSFPPYNVMYWEIGNEPDVDPADREPTPGNRAVFGCWGDKSKPATYGGEYYADMLKVVYPAIKLANPNAKVVIGGLLLDCDPANMPPGFPPGRCDSANFLKGILSNGGASYFDYVAYHGYAWYHPGNATTLPQAVDETNTSWAHLGGVVVGKYNYLRSVMASFPGVDKPIILNEAGLVCAEWFLACMPPPAYFYEDQADYLVRLFVRNMSLNITSTIWFTLEGPGWRYAGLYYDTQTTPKPAHDAMTFLTTELAGAAYVAPVNQYPGVWGYELRSSTKKIWVLGVSGPTGYTVALPAGVLKVYNKYGATVHPSGNQVFVKSPIYVEFAP